MLHACMVMPAIVSDASYIALALFLYSLGSGNWLSAVRMHMYQTCSGCLGRLCSGPGDIVIGDSCILSVICS